jgi:hypothetical protein
MTRYQFLLVPPNGRNGATHSAPRMLEMQCAGPQDALRWAKRIRSTFPGLVGLRESPPPRPFAFIDIDTQVPPEDPVKLSATLLRAGVSTPAPLDAILPDLKESLK